jgi:TolA-binding protein
LKPLRWFSVLVIALAVSSVLVLPQNSNAAPYRQELEKLNRLVQASSGSDAETKIFREGRDLVGDEAWNQAANKFREYINKYPKGKDTDAALYWLAFALKKQEKYQEADRSLERLINEYPKSKWKDDASSMRVELASALPDRQSDGAPSCLESS